MNHPIERTVQTLQTAIQNMDISADIMRWNFGVFGYRPAY